MSRRERAPAARWAAPGRVNLIGEHTDYNDGFVLPLALPYTTSATVSRRDDGRLRVRSAQRAAGDEQAAVADLAPGSVRGWAAYAAGVVWALREAGHDVGAGLDVAIDSDVPEGAGLSSSAALECAVAAAARRPARPRPVPARAGPAGAARRERLRRRPDRRHGPGGRHAVYQRARAVPGLPQPAHRAGAPGPRPGRPGDPRRRHPDAAPARRRRVRPAPAGLRAGGPGPRRGRTPRHPRRRPARRAGPAGRRRAAPPGPARGDRERPGAAGGGLAARRRTRARWARCCPPRTRRCGTTTR